MSAAIKRIIGNVIEYFTGNLLTGNENENNHEQQQQNLVNEIEKPLAASVGYSYIFKTRQIDCGGFKFNIRYLCKEKQVWIVLVDIVSGLNCELYTDTIVRDLQDHIKPLNLLLFSKIETVDKIKCIDRTGVIELIKRYVDRDNQHVVVKWFDRHVYNQSAVVDTTKVLMNLEKQNNILIEKLMGFENKIAELDKRITFHDNISSLYDSLCEYHKEKNLSSSSSFLSSGETNLVTVRLPRNVSKHQHLAIFAKPIDDCANTKVAYLFGQKKHFQNRKRKFQDMELVYESVHPNPQMAIHVINEELEMESFNCVKRARSVYEVDRKLDSFKSFINKIVL
ncbi:ac13 [Malacosoma neustria nucleopolyhedrovirus]|uniref:ac13 n=1 Tax=Malacosoma neustria nuclear polyhedrosis virus TaxID=38012 RepID=UPI000E35A1D6|nr:ac13 [Malacosoma neustria nucleopolyhedrovirus]AUF81656.1 ac13 [Malacosoma neustria nucleopolyhedrovirus]